MFLYSVAMLQDSAAAAGTASGHGAPQDTAGKVAYVTQRSGPPDTSSYMYAGYVVALLCYAGYIALMVRRIAHSKRQLDALNSGGGDRR
ncbi:MAG TPA: hypothetical protein VGE27_07160 [Gemmatimonas sp.]|uniref:hypothetical protein n=1 Tax=Gemmatimonas sp. TaxID=1962908 RepID=UPI002EDA7998